MDKQKFDKTGNNPMEWVFSADSLLAACRFLSLHSSHLREEAPSERFPTFDEYRIHDVIVMLRAMAIECLLKALWLKSGNKLAKNGKYCPIPNAKDHDLLSLYNAIADNYQITLTKGEKDFINRLSGNITAGRYPIQRNLEKNRKPLVTAQLTRMPTVMILNPDNDYFHSIVEKIKVPLKGDIDAFYAGIKEHGT
jgi:hypothetical protein